jgi:hypothetical protein
MLGITHSFFHAGNNILKTFGLKFGCSQNRQPPPGTPLNYADGEIVNLLRKHGGKTGEELKTEGK